MRLPKDPGRFSFGATSATVTSLGLIMGLLEASNPRASIIGALLLIAVADILPIRWGFTYTENLHLRSLKTSESLHSAIS